MLCFRVKGRRACRTLIGQSINECLLSKSSNKGHTDVRPLMTKFNSGLLYS